MRSTLETLEAEVLQLSASDRSHLLERLILSLDTDPAVEQAWQQEAARRDAELESGAVQPVSGDEMMARLRARLGRPAKLISGDQPVNITFECKREADGQWLAEVPELPGALAYGQSPAEAISNAESLAFRMLAAADSDVKVPATGISRRQPSPLVAGTRIIGDIMSPVADADDWDQEIRMRVDEINSGIAKLLPAEGVLAAVRRLGGR